MNCPKCGTSCEFLVGRPATDRNMYCPVETCGWTAWRNDTIWPEHVVRMVTEKQQLAERYDRLVSFLNDGPKQVAANLPAEDLDLLRQQSTHMYGYLNILSARLDRELAKVR